MAEIDKLNEVLLAKVTDEGMIDLRNDTDKVVQWVQLPSGGGVYRYEYSPEEWYRVIALLKAADDVAEIRTKYDNDPVVLYSEKEFVGEEPVERKKR